MHRKQILSFLFTALLCCQLSFAALLRDPLTPMEADRVRDAQQLDKRIEVFIKVVERRFLLLADPNAPSSKQIQKDLELWGELPAGTRAELVEDIAKAIDEAINNIDDSTNRPAQKAFVSKAVKRLADACAKFIAQLEAISKSLTAPREKHALDRAIENAQAVIDAAKRL